MRGISNAVVLSALFLAASAAAGTDKGASAPLPAPTPAPGAGSGSGSGSDAANTPAPAFDPNAVKPEDMPTPVRMRRLEQKTQALKERAWQLKARVQMLKEQMLGGGVGAQAVIAHSNEMGAAFRLIKLVYSLDGTELAPRTDDTGETLYKTKSFDIFSGPIAPGNHTLTVVAEYRGSGYSVFNYMSKYTFTARDSTSFTAAEGKITKVDCKGFEKGGGVRTEKKPAIDCKVTQVAPEKPAEPTASPTPGTTPLPAAPVK